MDEKLPKIIWFIFIAVPVAIICIGQWLMWGKNVFNLHTLLLFIGFAVGYVTACSAVIWPAYKKSRKR